MDGHGRRHRPPPCPSTCRLFKSSITTIIALVCLTQFVSCNQPPRLITNIDLTTIKENTAIGTTVATLKAVDPENSKISYQLEGNLLTKSRKMDTIS